MSHKFTQFERCGMVGIAATDFLLRRNEAVAKKEYDPPEDDPIVWVNSRGELEEILKSPLHPRHDRVRRAAIKNSKHTSAKPMAARKPFPHVDADQADNVHRLLLLLEEMAKPRHADRHAHVRALLQEQTRFSMDAVYVGKKDAAGRWRVSSVHPIGLAALDPWFHGRGLCPSIIPMPGDTDSLDVGGVMIMTRKHSWRRWDLSKDYVAEFFGIGAADWEKLVDSRKYATREYDTEEISPDGKVSAAMVRDRLLFYTETSHARKFTGAALLPETVQAKVVLR